FNVRLVDDKSYPYLAVSVDDEWPRPRVMRGRKKKGTRYFGPYAHAYAIRDTLDSLLRTFPVRTCSDNKLERHRKLGKPCLLFHIEKCSGPCVGEVTHEQYQTMVGDLCQFLEGDTDPVIHRLESSMMQAAEELEFEQAARLRDRIATVKKAVAKQMMVGERTDDIDVIGVAEDELEALVFIFVVRRGRVVGRRSFVIDRVEDLDTNELIDKVLEGVYDEEPVQGMPKVVLVPNEPSQTELYQEWLSMLRGSNVEIRVPQRGDKKDLLATVTKNADEEFTRHRMKRASDHNARAKALNELQEWLGLPARPLRIECFDMQATSRAPTTSGRWSSSRTVWPTSEYRRFKIKTVDQNDDYARWKVVRRRLTAYKRRPRQATIGTRQVPVSTPAARRRRRQGAADLRREGARSSDLFDSIPVASLAKRFEGCTCPTSPNPSGSLANPKRSHAAAPARRSHRFAISYHRNLRGKRMTVSVLDDIPGLGATRRSGSSASSAASTRSGGRRSNP
ncbi:MAG: excinuclease ABC subunit UvrC, partial [Acidimicrobiales bacterium]